MTLIAVYNSSGCVGRCDARCYNATEPNCVCICGGKNHGAGLNKALDNTREYCAQWLKDCKKEFGRSCKSEINGEVWQPSLPFEELAEVGASNGN